MWAGWGEGGAERWGVAMVPMWVETMSVGLGYAGTGSGGIGLVWAESMREYMRLWKSCVMSGVIMWSVGRRKEKVGQRGTSSGCGGCP